MSRLPSPDASAVRTEVERLLFDLPGFLSCTLVRNAPDAEGHTKAVIRPVALQGSEAFQVTRTGGPSAGTANFPRKQARTLLAELWPDAVETHVMTSHVDVHVRVTRKGRMLLTRSRPLQRTVAERPAHDREKDYPLTRFASQPLLRAIGFSDAQDRILPSMQAKYRQVNEFLRILDAVLPTGAPSGEAQPLRILDAGCGKAYLSFAAQAYLGQTRQVPVELTGVDVRQDLVDACRATAERLSLAPPSAAFVAADIAGFTPSPVPDVVVSLHACDTATDEAIARGIEWGARAIVCAPCCQHEIQRQLPSDGPQRALLRHGILRERLADLLADAFRAQILRILGYRVKVVEFVDPEATGRNVLIRAERGVRPGMADVSRNTASYVPPGARFHSWRRGWQTSCGTPWPDCPQVPTLRHPRRRGRSRRVSGGRRACA